MQQNNQNDVFHALYNYNFFFFATVLLRICYIYIKLIYFKSHFWKLCKYKEIYIFTYNVHQGSMYQNNPNLVFHPLSKFFLTVLSRLFAVWSIWLYLINLTCLKNDYVTFTPLSALQSVMSSGSALTPGKTGGVGSAVFTLHHNGSLDYQVTAPLYSLISRWLGQVHRLSALMFSSRFCWRVWAARWSVWRSRWSRGGAVNAAFCTTSRRISLRRRSAAAGEWWEAAAASRPDTFTCCCRTNCSLTSPRPSSRRANCADRYECCRTTAWTHAETVRKTAFTLKTIQ